MIKLLWPTVRPKVMKATYKHWMDTAVNPSDISVSIAVNTQEQRNELSEFDDVIIVGTKRRGPVHATNQLSQRVQGDPKDIIILISDDFYSPPKWDAWLKKQFKNYNGAIIVRDGYQSGGCITIPIMTYRCLLMLNRFIYHPSYEWQYSDAELWHNLKALKLVRPLRTKEYPLFEHRHWVNNKRKMDANDQPGVKSGGRDHANYKRRLRMPVKQRLK